MIVYTILFLSYNIIMLRPTTLYWNLYFASTDLNTYRLENYWLNHNSQIHSEAIVIASCCRTKQAVQWILAILVWADGKQSSFGRRVQRTMPTTHHGWKPETMAFISWNARTLEQSSKGSKFGAKAAQSTRPMHGQMSTACISSNWATTSDLRRAAPESQSIVCSGSTCFASVTWQGWFIPIGSCTVSRLWHWRPAWATSGCYNGFRRWQSDQVQTPFWGIWFRWWQLGVGWEMRFKSCRSTRWFREEFL